MDPGIARVQRGLRKDLVLLSYSGAFIKRFGRAGGPAESTPAAPASILKLLILFDCPGEELNFLTTIFSRTLYHLSYRDSISE